MTFKSTLHSVELVIESEIASCLIDTMERHE